MGPPVPLNVAQVGPKKRGRPAKTDTATRKRVNHPSSCRTTPPRATVKRYPKAEVAERNAEWAEVYTTLLECARRGDTTTMFLFSPLKKRQKAVVKSCQSVHAKVELLDIYHYLVRRQDIVPHKVSMANFGPLIGVDLAKQTLSDWIRREDELRAAALCTPPEKCNIMKKNKKH
ncbi:hypothetical protein DFQ26_007037 [Actinomortierella ambigua]|nr:hypothetical protein DFQ26_007037 [Actinomortierella ambigua]